MNILFLSLAKFDDINVRAIYADLMREFIKQGSSVYIASPSERRFGKRTHLREMQNCQILKIRTLNIQKTNIIEKGLGILLLERQFEKAIMKYWGNIKFDLVLYATPPITFNKVIAGVKKRCGARSYLLLKDIFPQNAVDMQMMSKSSLIYKLFRKKEETLYAISDKIGCMSPANVKYVINNNPSVDPAKVEVCPNTITLSEQTPLSSSKKEELKSKFEIPSDRALFIYGGNLGKPQGIDFLIKVIAENEHNDDAYIVIVGNGTEFNKIQNWFNENKPQNSKLMSAMPKEDYEDLVKTADVGLIFLDHRFTIPNYPSRLLSYLENQKPIIAATDLFSDIGPIAEVNGYGFWCESGDITTFMQHMRKLSSDSALRQSMGEAGYTFLCNNYLTKHAISKILNA